MAVSKPVIYHSTWCRSLRPIWLLIELDVDFDIKAYTWDGLKSSEFLAINPEGRVPILEDGDVRMAESGAIVQFLAEKYGQGKATVTPGTPEHAAYCQWFHISEASFMPGPAALYHWNEPTSDKNPEVKKQALKTINDILKILEKDLAKQGPASYLVTSHPTAADFMMGYPLFMIEDCFKGDVDLAAFPKVKGYIHRLRALPSAQATFGKYNDLSAGTHHVPGQPARS